MMPVHKVKSSTEGSNHSRRPDRIVYSFDLFDTLVTRRTATPHGVFLEMAQRLRSQSHLASFAERFVDERIAAEDETRRRSSHEEITLSEIHATLAERLSLTSEQVETFEQLEFSVEREMIRPIPSAFARVRQLLDAGEQVVIISDMYLPSEFLRQCVAEFDETLARRCQWFVSSDYRLTKGTGNLFRQVAKELEVRVGQMRHAGDNRRADVVAAKRVGIVAEWVRETQLTGWETFACDHRSSEWQFRAGEARLRRLGGRSIRDAIGYAIAGPILGPFVAWALREAKRQGCRKVFFLARDGWVMQEMARLYQTQPEFQQLNVGYLYGSRQAWRLPAMAPPTDADYHWALTSNRRTTLRGIAHRLGMDPASFWSRVRESGVECANADTPLDAGQLTVLEQLFVSGHFDAEVQRAANNQAELLEEYLRAEGLEGNGPFALVDLGWKGTMQDALERFLQQRGSATPITGFYLGLTSASPARPVGGKQSFAATYPDPRFTSESLHESAVFLEALSTACHGSTMRYERDTMGRVVPVLDHQSRPITDWGYADVAQGAIDYVRDHLSRCSDMHAGHKATQLAADYLEYLRSPHLDSSFAECLGSFPFTPDSEASTLGELGPRRRWLDGVRFALSHSQKRMEITAWPQATARRSDTWTAMLFHPHFRWLALAVQPWRLYDYVPYSVSRRIKAVLPRPIVRRLERLLFGRSFEATSVESRSRTSIK